MDLSKKETRKEEREDKESRSEVDVNANIGDRGRKSAEKLARTQTLRENER